MGLFKKIIDVFYDPVEGEEETEIRDIPKREIVEEVKPRPVEKKEEKIKIEEIHLPKEEVKPESSVYNEREMFKTETKTFKFPILEEEEKEKPMVRSSRSSIYMQQDIPKKETKEERFENLRREINKETNREIKPEVKKEENKKFKLTPPISPVFGILDQNYKKEDIIERTEPIIHRTGDMNYDSVRRKAYGTLEDELENTLTKISKNNEEIEKTIEETNNFDAEENNKSIEDLLSEIEGNKSTSYKDVEDNNEEIIDNDSFPTFRSIKEDISDDEEKEENEESDSFDKTLEHDLFNLIDSMYEDKEE